MNTIEYIRNWKKPLTTKGMVECDNTSVISIIRFYPKHFTHYRDYTDKDFYELIINLPSGIDQDLVRKLCDTSDNFKTVWEKIGDFCYTTYYNYWGRVIFFLKDIGHVILMINDDLYQLCNYDTKYCDVQNNWITSFTAEDLISKLPKWKFY